MYKKIIVNDKMQKHYEYFLSQPAGSNFDPEFKPQLSPKELLAMGIFGGRYLRDCINEFPRDWYLEAKLLPQGQKGHDWKLNFFSIDASQSLKVWQRNGWIHPDDPRGWFQWYCRYYMGRRHLDDKRQIKRWKAMRRHIVQIKNNCFIGDYNCHRRQRQALLHWAYDSRFI